MCEVVVCLGRDGNGGVKSDGEDRREELVIDKALEGRGGGARDEVLVTGRKETEAHH